MAGIGKSGYQVVGIRLSGSGPSLALGTPARAGPSDADRVLGEFQMMKFRNLRQSALIGGFDFFVRVLCFFAASIWSVVVRMSYLFVF